MLMQKVEEILDEGGFSYCGYGGCFDIAARRDSMLFLKVLTNIDSFQEEQASSLKVISDSMGARSFVIGLHTRREKLSDNVVYERFDVPAVTPRTFENIIASNFPLVYRFRGGLFAEINPARLREAREQSGLTQSQLAGRVGVTKKSVYEHESGKAKIEYDNAVRMEKILKTELMEPLSMEQEKHNIDITPKTGFEAKVSRIFRRIGFRTSSVYQSPFNMIAESDTMIISDVEEKPKNMEKKIRHIKDFARIAEKSAMVVTKDEANFDIPSITRKKLTGLDSKAIKKFVRKW